MDDIIEFIKNLMNKQFLNSVVIVLLSVILYKAIIYVLKKGEKSESVKLFEGKRSKTYLRLVISLIRYVFIVITVLILLQVNGIDVSSALAGVGILGVILGLAIQDWLKDIIRGSSIISDNYFSVGDVVKYKETEGKVLVIGVKSTKIQDLKTGYIKTIANRNIEEIDIVSKIVYVNVPMPYELRVEDAEKVVYDIVESIKNNNDVEEVSYISVDDLGDSYISYKLKIICNPINKLQVRRDALRSILVEMERNNVSVPYTQIDIHNK